MPPRPHTISPPTNPFLQVLYIVVGGLLLIGAILMGAVILAVALGLAVILGIAVYLRVWWLNRKLKRSARGGREAQVLEVEYTVVDERDERDERDDRGPGG
jgi:hypothetical protein